ncbi:MAG: carboxylating nicotinate-nucleotide diphosphorylase [Flavobacteriales bacterium]|nr:carboxylating nicotinate-nucleotide diphosphorylase [Flavobacteriales bacterium]
MTIDEIIEAALREDIGDGDHTSNACIPADAKGSAQLLVKESGVVAGVELAHRIFHHVDATLKVDVRIVDGSPIAVGDVILTVEGSSRSILKAERLVLNFMQRMSGIATHAQRLVRLTDGTNTRLLDTRKTTPLLRELEKLAVKLGGGQNHRFGLYDMVMIKDNHIDMAGGLAQALHRVKGHLATIGKDLRVEVEVRDFDELEEALRVGGFHRIMLDNFTPEKLKLAVETIAGRYETESSGGITESNLREHALTGVDFISVGALTHHIRSLDMSLKAVHHSP